MTSEARSREVRIWIWFCSEDGSVGSCDNTADRSVILFLRVSSITLAELEYSVGRIRTTAAARATVATATAWINPLRSRTTRARSPSWKLAASGAAVDAEDMLLGLPSASGR